MTTRTRRFRRSQSMFSATAVRCRGTGPTRVAARGRGEQEGALINRVERLAGRCPGRSARSEPPTGGAMGRETA
jgi:hypothetical protein